MVSQPAAGIPIYTVGDLLAGLRGAVAVARADLGMTDPAERPESIVRAAASAEKQAIAHLKSALSKL